MLLNPYLDRHATRTQLKAASYAKMTYGYSNRTVKCRRQLVEFVREKKKSYTVPTLLPSVFLGGNLKLSTTANCRRNYRKNRQKNNLVKQRTNNLKYTY